MTEKSSQNLDLAQQEKTTAEGFKISGVNETSLIRSLSLLNGISIDRLEAQMRPGVLSNAGFLGKDESLTQVLAKDNDAVLGMGLTHQKLADFLFHASEGDYFSSNFKNFEYNGRKFTRHCVVSMGFQESPFEDGTMGNEEYDIVCLENNLAIRFSTLLPFMIERYGFYEGKGTPYRVEPKKVAEIAGLIPQSK